MKRPGQIRRGAYLNRMRKRPVRKPLNRVSKKRQRLAKAAAGVRREWINKARACMVCGHSSANPNRTLPIAMSKLVVHEISNGPQRGVSLDKPYCCLVACVFCNEYKLVDKREWPEARQLCLLKVRAPRRYNLRLYIKHTSPNAPQRITAAEVRAYLESIPDGCSIPRCDS